MWKFSAILLAFACLTSGCTEKQKFGPRKPVVFIIDQDYRTGGASEAILGSYGFVAGKSILFPRANSYEREGIPRNLANIEPRTKAILTADATKKIVSEVDANVKIPETISIGAGLGNDSSSTAKLHLHIIELDKDKLIERINLDPKFVQILRDDRNRRVVTSIAVLLSMSDETFNRISKAKLKVADITETGDVTLTVTDSESSNIKVEPGNIYCYQFAKPRFTKDESAIDRLANDPIGVP